MTQIATGPTDGATGGVAQVTTDIDELERTTGLLVRTARELARDTDVAMASLDRIAGVPARQALVVVGETKKGKSSVVNALLGRPGVSPVAVEVATATYVVFQHGPDEAWVLRADGATERVELDDLAPWVSVEGLTANPRAPAADAATPVSAYLDVELLRDVTIIDTPGVGGLVGAHTAATLEAIRLAGAMLLVTDISVPLTEPEAQFLRKVSEIANLAEIIIVANKSDKLLADDVRAAEVAAKARIAEAIPALADAPFVVVAAARALRALEPGVMPQASRDRMRQVSGLDELERVIDMRVRQRSKVLVEGARLQLVHRAATTLVDAARTRAALLSSDDADERVNELQDRMIELGHQVEMARLTFTNDLANLKVSLNTRLDSAFADLSNELLRMVKSDAPQTDIERAFDDRLAEMSRELSQLAEANIASATRTNFEHLTENDESGALLRSALETAAAQAGAEIDRRENRLYQETPVPADAVVSSALGLTSGVAFGGIVGNAFGLGAFANPIGVILGPAIVIMNLRRLRRTARSNETREWLRECLATARRDLSASINGRFDDANYITNIALRNFHKAQADELRLMQRSASVPARRKQLQTIKHELDTANQLATVAAQQLKTIGVPLFSSLPALGR